MKSNSIWNQGAPLVIAHRGASAYAPENTASAFQLALDLGADALEVDVKLTRDGVAILMHDSSLDRTTNGTGRVSDHLYNDISVLDAGKWHSPEYMGEPIPTLAGFLHQFGEQCLLNLELTNYSTPLDPLPRIVIDLVTKAGLEERVLLSSFSPMNLIHIRRISPAIKLGLLIHRGEPHWLRRLYQKLLDYDFLHLQESLISSETGRQALKSSKLIHVWTTNQEERIHQLMLEPMINGIITDVPDIARKVWLRLRDDRRDKLRQSG
jgi:glycerophosphoryl diester phosphodiesterase